MSGCRRQGKRALDPLHRLVVVRAPRPSLRAEHVQATRAALVAAGEQLFGEAGFTATSVEELAARGRCDDRRALPPLPDEEGALRDRLRDAAPSTAVSRPPRRASGRPTPSSSSPVDSRHRSTPCSTLTSSASSSSTRRPCSASTGTSSWTSATRSTRSSRAADGPGRGSPAHRQPGDGRPSAAGCPDPSRHPHRPCRRSGGHPGRRLAQPARAARRAHPWAPA